MVTENVHVKHVTLPSAATASVKPAEPIVFEQSTNIDLKLIRCYCMYMAQGNGANPSRPLHLHI